MTDEPIWMPGGPVAEAVLADVDARVAALREQGTTVGLGTIVVGDDPASHSYVAKKHTTSEAHGITSHHQSLPSDASQSQVIEAVQRFNEDEAVTAYLVQLPLPKGLDEGPVLEAIDPAKDADGLHPTNLGKLALGMDCPVACTPAGIKALLAHYEVPVSGRHVVIVGRGPTLGRPLSMLLSAKADGANAAVTMVHTGVADIAQHTRQADVVIGAAGVPSSITADMVRPGAAVISGGITWEGKRLLPDVDESVAEVAGWITPRLGGVGPTTVAMLLSNTVAAAERRSGR